MTIWMAHLAVFGTFVLLGTIVIIQAVRLRRAAREPHCPNCLYIITGLTQSVCPECGTDLMEAGYIPAGSKAEPFLWPALGYSAFVLLFIGPVLFWLLQVLVIPSSYTGEAIADGLTAHLTEGVSIQATGSTLAWSATDTSPGITPRHIEVTLRTGGLPYRLSVEVPGMQFSYVPPAGAAVGPRGPLAEADVIRWFDAVGSSSVRAGDQRVAREAFAIIDGMAHTPDLRQLQSDGAGAQAIIQGVCARPAPALVDLAFSYWDHGAPLLAFNPWGIWLTLGLWLVAMRLILPRKRLAIHFVAFSKPFGDAGQQGL